MNEDSPPQLSKRARTRERLIAVANDLFLEKGVHRTSLQDIAARAGVTKGAIYSSFQSKEELVAAVIAETVIALRPVLSPGMAIEQILAALGAAAISMMPEVKARASLVAEYNLYALSHERLRSLMEVNHAKAYEDALAEVERILPSNLSMSPRQIVITLQALTVGFFQQRTLYPSLFTDDDVMAAFRAIGSALNVRSPLLNSEGSRRESGQDLGLNPFFCARRMLVGADDGAVDHLDAVLACVGLVPWPPRLGRRRQITAAVWEAKFQLHRVISLPMVVMLVSKPAITRPMTPPRRTIIAGPSH